MNVDINHQNGENMWSQWFRPWTDCLCQTWWLLLESVSCWNKQLFFNFDVWADLWTLAYRMYWYLVKTILTSTCTILPVPPAATQPQSIMDPPQCFTVGKGFFSKKASPFFLQTYLLWWWPKSYILGSSVKAHCSKRLQASQCFLLHTSDIMCGLFCSDLWV